MNNVLNTKSTGHRTQKTEAQNTEHTHNTEHRTQNTEHTHNTEHRTQKHRSTEHRTQKHRSTETQKHRTLNTEAQNTEHRSTEAQKTENRTQNTKHRAPSWFPHIYNLKGVTCQNIRRNNRFQNVKMSKTPMLSCPDVH